MTVAMTPGELATSQGLTLARDVETLAGEWLVWFGRSTRHFWAVRRHRPHCRDTHHQQNFPAREYRHTRQRQLWITHSAKGNVLSARR